MTSLQRIIEVTPAPPNLISHAATMEDPLLKRSSMRVVALPAVLALLAGCSVVPPQAWTYDPSHPPKAVLATEEAVALTSRVADLQLQRTQIRDRIAAEPDAWARQSEYRALHRVGMQLSPLERELGSAAQAR
jgi:hypothetical protein